MTHVRVSVSLSQPELAALVQMAQTDCRHPREQLRYLVREEAKHRGLTREQYEEIRREQLARNGGKSRPKGT